jgi:hypothetical protein
MLDGVTFYHISDLLLFVLCCGDVEFGAYLCIILQKTKRKSNF